MMCCSAGSVFNSVCVCTWICSPVYNQRNNKTRRSAIQRMAIRWRSILTWSLYGRRLCRAGLTGRLFRIGRAGMLCRAGLTIGGGGCVLSLIDSGMETMLALVSRNGRRAFNVARREFRNTVWK